MTSEGGDEGIFAKLAEIAGGVRLIDAKLDQSNKLHDERHERVQADIRDLRDRTHKNANGIQELFGWRHTFEGERKGLALTGRVAWAGIGTLIGGGGIVGLMKLFGG